MTHQATTLPTSQQPKGVLMKRLVLSLSMMVLSTMAFGSEGVILSGSNLEVSDCAYTNGWEYSVTHKKQVILKDRYKWQSSCQEDVDKLRQAIVGKRKIKFIGNDFEILPQCQIKLGNLIESKEVISVKGKPEDESTKRKILKEFTKSYSTRTTFLDYTGTYVLGSPEFYQKERGGIYLEDSNLNLVFFALTQGLFSLPDISFGTSSETRVPVSFKLDAASAKHRTCDSVNACLVGAIDREEYDLFYVKGQGLGCF